MDIEALFSEYHTQVTAMAGDIGKLKTEVDKIGKDVDSATNKLAGFIGAGVADGSPAAATGNGRELKKVLAAFARNQSASPVELCHFIGSSPQAALSIGSNPDGGYAVIPEFEKQIGQVAHDISPMRGLASVVQISTELYEVLVDPTLAEVNWVGETQSRANDTDAGKVFKAKITVNEMAASPRATQSLLDDAFMDIGAWLTAKIGTSMALKEGSAFVGGDGVMKPRGFLSYPMSSDDDFNADGSLDRDWGVLGYYAVGSATPTDTQLADAIVGTAAKLRVPYRPNATWTMQRSVYAKVRTLKDSQNRYLLSTDGRLADAAPELLCGFPIAFSEDMPAEGANATPIALGDFKQGYTIVDRFGIRVLRNPFTANPFVVFKTNKRVGGGVLNFHAIKTIKYV